MNQQGLTFDTHNLWLKSKYISEGQEGQPGSTAVDAVVAIDKTTPLVVPINTIETNIDNFQGIFFQRNVDIDLALGQFIITKPGLYGIIGHVTVDPNGTTDNILSLALKINNVTSREFRQNMSDINPTSIELSSYEDLVVGDIVSLTITNITTFVPQSLPFTLTAAQMDMAQLQVAV